MHEEMHDWIYCTNEQHECETIAFVKHSVNIQIYQYSIMTLLSIICKFNKRDFDW